MADEDVNRPSKVKLLAEPKRHFDDFFRVDEYQVSHEKFDGSMSTPQRVLVFDRGHAVAALLYDPVLRQVIFIDQFRLPTYHRVKGADHKGTGWIYETAAGVIDEGERPFETLKREVEEETGYVIERAEDATLIGSFYSSPGGSTEVIHLYLATVNSLQKKGKGQGVLNEDIRIIQMDVLEFFKRLTEHKFADPKLLLSGYFLKDRLASSTNRIAEGMAPPTRYCLKGRKDLIIGIRPGDILNSKDIDVWVNSENTDMEMNHFHARGVSATIRFAGAVKHADGRKVKEDTIADALKVERSKHGYVGPATVLETTSGELAKSHNVKRIFHVAAVEGAFGQGLKFDDTVLDKCVDDVLQMIERANRSLKRERACRSVLLPMIGSGNAGAPLTTVAPKIVARSIAYLEGQAKAGSGALKEIYLSAFDDRADLLLRRLLAAEQRLERLDELAVS